MALSYVGGTSGGGTGASYTVSLNGTLTGGSNSSPSAGDLILVFTGEANNASVTSACSGNTAGAYSTIRAHQNQADTHDANLDSFYKFAGATPDTTLTITRGSNNTTYGSATVVHVWRGADSANPFNVTPTVASSANGSAANPAEITPTTAGSVVLYCGHASQLAASGTAYTTAGTYPISLKFDGSTGDSIVMASHYTAWTSGAYDPAAFAGSTTATTLGWVALTLVINPFIPVTHATTSAIAGSNSAAVGSAAHIATHTTTGVLTGSNASVVGAAEQPSARPVRVSTTLWQQDLLGTAGNPGAKSITVPSDAQAVVVQFHSGAGFTEQALSITSDFAGTFTVSNSGEQNQCSLGYALVTSTGAKNLTLSFGGTVVEGPTVYISFIKNIDTSDWVRETSVLGTSASGASRSNVFDTSEDDLLLVVNDNDSATPSTISGFTSLATTGTTYNQPSRLQSCDAPGASTTTVTGTSTDFDVLSGISIKPGTTGPATHATTGALAAGEASVVCASAHIAIHGTTGALSGPNASASGSAARFRAFSTTGTLAGSGTIVSGAAARFLSHATTGDLSGSGSTVAGIAARWRAFPTSGTLTGPGATISGSAARFRAHATTGAIAGDGQSIAGTSARTRQHAATGILSAPESAIAGSAQHNFPHASSGTLAAGDAAVSGNASRNTTQVSHATTGELTGDGAATAGAANRFRAFSASCVLAGAESSLAGSASRTREHAATSVLVGDTSSLSASAQRNASHATDGTLAADSAAVAGTSSHVAAAVTHGTTGALSGSSARVSGIAGISVLITSQQVEMLTDIWQRLGLDPSAPLTETEAEARFGGIVLEKSGDDIITSTRTGASASGNTDLMIRDIWRRLGLDASTPMSAAADRISAGWLEQTITPTDEGVIVARIEPPYTATPGYFTPGYLENQE